MNESLEPTLPLTAPCGSTLAVQTVGGESLKQQYRQLWRQCEAAIRERDELKTKLEAKEAELSALRVAEFCD